MNTNTVEVFLTSRYDFKFNEISNKLEFKRRTDTDYQELTEYFMHSLIRQLHQAGIKIQKKDLGEMLYSDFTVRYNPFLEYFNGLPVYYEEDNDYIQDLANTVVVSPEEREHWNIWFRKWMVGVVACAIDERHVNQTVLVFVGSQGIGKTAWFNRLPPSSLSSYCYSGSINPGNKDSEIQLSENLLINLDELENLGRRNLQSLKETITKQYIKIRRPYATHVEQMPRRASFMGSVNDIEFLKDETGNRRFLCFEALNIDYMHNVNMDMVYAQALYLFRNGVRFWFREEEIVEINLHNERYRSVSLEQEVIESLFEPCPPNIEPELRLQTSELLIYIFNHSSIGHRLSVRGLGIALKRMNWSKRKINGTRYWLLNTKRVELRGALTVA